MFYLDCKKYGSALESAETLEESLKSEMGVDCQVELTHFYV